MRTTDNKTFIEDSHHAYALADGDSSHAVILVNYSIFLLGSLGCFILYLLLPKGLRKYMCNAYPKRYARSKSRTRASISSYNDDRVVIRPLSQYKTTLQNLVGSTWEKNDEWTVSDFLSSSPSGLELGPSRETYQDALFSRQKLLEQGTIDKDSINISSDDNASDNLSRTYETSSDVIDLNIPNYPRALIESKNDTTVSKHSLYLDEEEEIVFHHRSTNILHPKKHENQVVLSLNHPNPNHISPSMAVVQSCMSSMKQQPGVRLFAHGTRCQPRKVWIRLDSSKDAFIWRTETASNDSLSLSQSVGQSREIILSDVLYIDIGKTTAALKAIPETTIPQSLCLSILSKQGSLDLSAKTPLERDAIVSCTCLILDERCSRNDSTSKSHWRNLYNKVVDRTEKGSDILSDVDTSI